MKVAAQGRLDLEPRTWGGAREGAGRKRLEDKRDPDHVVRPYFAPSTPIHVSLRTRPDVPRLRQPKIYEAIREALEVTCHSVAVRIIHTSIQHNHIHMIVEAETRELLWRTMQAFAIRAARAINKACGRKGKVFAYRYHAVYITSRKQARHTLSYVLNNWRRHDEDRANARSRAAAIDPYSTGIWFRGWAGVGDDGFALPAGFKPLPAANAMSWLLTVGWRKHGLIGLRERPGPLRRRRATRRVATSSEAARGSSEAARRSSL